MYKNLISLCLVCQIFSLLFTAKAQQNVNPEVFQFTPKSPEVSNLGRYFDFPVGTSTGVPEINIPIWQVKYGGISLPINLNYHAGGIKVDDIASNAGLGWLLSSGGSIMKLDRGLPDKVNFGFDYTNVNRYINNLMSNQEKYSFFGDIYRGNEDVEPDVYAFNVAGIQGKFFELGNGEFVSIPRDLGVKITKEGSYNWRITDKTGNKYFFQNSEHTETVFDIYSYSGLNTIGPKNSNNLWQITKIQDIAGNEVSFDYVPIYSTLINKPIEKVEIYSIRYYNYGRINKTATVTTTANSGWLLNKITYGNTEIKFNYSELPRLDYDNNYALKNVEVKYAGNATKKFTFYTSYFLNNNIGTTNYPIYYQYQQMDTYRLRLDSLKQESINDVSNSYKFEYYFNTGLPYRLSNAQDHWGYYNGKNNTSFISYKDLNGLMVGPDRDVSPNHVQECSLKKITYPTRGYQLFEYESNTANMIISGSRDSIVNVGNLSGSNLQRTYNEGYLFTSDTLHFDSYFNGSYSFNYTSIPTSNDFGFYGIIKNINDGSEQVLQNGNHPINISAGSYVIIGEILDYTYDPMYPKELDFDITLFKAVTISRHQGPGLRIKKIINHFDSEKDEVRLYDYNVPNSTTSSGVLVNDINFNIYKIDKFYAGEMDGELANQSYIEYSSVPNYPLSPVGSTYISYSYVTEYFDDQKKFGKRITKFTNIFDFEELSNTQYVEYPFVPTPFVEHKIGKPILTEIYSYENNLYKIRSKTIAKYNTIANLEIKRPAIKVGFQFTLQPNGPQGGANDSMYYTAAQKINYEVKSDVFKLIADTTFSYFDNNQISSTNNYQYSPVNFELISVTKNASDGRDITIKYKYPYNYVQDNNDVNGVYSGMVANHMISNIVETESFKNLNSIARTKYLYDKVNTSSNNFIALKEVKNWNRDLDQDESDKKVEIYDDRGNPIKVVIKDFHEIILIYSYNKQYLVAEIKNANYSDVINILGGQSAVDTFSSGNPTDIEVNNFLAPLRNSSLLNKSQITSYTYQPLVGIASQTDEKGQTAFYEYDNFKRLKWIKDQNGNIIKSYNYNYKN